MTVSRQRLRVKPDCGRSKSHLINDFGVDGK